MRFRDEREAKAKPRRKNPHDEEQRIIVNLQLDYAPPPKTGMSTGLKLAIGGCLALVLFGGGFLVACGVWVNTVSKELRDSNLARTSDSPGSDRPLSRDENVKARIASVELMNKRATTRCVASLAGANQDILTITAPIKDDSKEEARAYAVAFINSLVSTPKSQEALTSIGFVAVVITDGKRSWTKDFQGGELIEKDAD